MSNKIAIVGAGVLGRTLALELHGRGWKITIFDPDPTGASSSSSKAAGMLAPYCEMEYAEPVISNLGIDSLEIWPVILKKLSLPVFFQRSGSLVLAFAQDRLELQRLENQVSKLKQPSYEKVGREKIAELEPEIDSRLTQGLYFALEGQIDPLDFLKATEAFIRENKISWVQEEVASIKPHAVNHYAFDWVLDTRGLGAKKDITKLRGVRGELCVLRSKEVHLNRPVRLMHPRYPLYIAPKANGIFYVGATLIEKESEDPMTVRSALELLSAAYSIHSGFAESEIVKMSVGLRPAFTDHLPKIFWREGLVQLNGLYRHGFLVSPQIAKLAADFLEEKRASTYTDLWEQVA